MRLVRVLLFASLAASGLVGVLVLAYDEWLWSVAPSHAYGLAAFVAVDILLAIAVAGKIFLATLGSSLIAVLQFGAMLADLLEGEPAGVSATVFRTYLLTNTPFMVLLTLQLGLMVVSSGILAESFPHKQAHLSAESRHRRR